MEQLAVFLLFAVIAIVNMVLRKRSGVKDILDGGSPSPTAPNSPAIPRRVRGEQSEQERLRKFMEALGVPTVVEPPRKIARPQQQPRRSRKIETSLQPALPQAATPAPLPVNEESAVAATDASPAASGANIPASASTKPSGLIDFQALLKSPASIRTAFVLKEILGPPRSLQSFSGTPNLR